MPSEAVLFEANFERWKTSIYPALSDIDARFGRGGEAVTVTFGYADAQVAHVAQALSTLERELRRAGALVKADEAGPRLYSETRDPRARRSIPAPYRPRDGGLDIVGAERGSLNLVLEPYGLLLDVLLSDPIQAVATLVALFDGAIRARAWLRRGPGSAVIESQPPDFDTATFELPGLGTATVPRRGLRKVRIERTTGEQGGPETLTLVIDFVPPLDASTPHDA